MNHLFGLNDGATIESLTQKLALLNAELKILIDAGIALSSGYRVPESYENIETLKNQNALAQNATQAQINSVTLELNKLSSEDAAKKNADPAYQADQARQEVDKYNRQIAIFSMPGRYDFGMGSDKRNRFYKEAGMSGLYAMNRPTMGMDIWSVVSSGITQGVNEYKKMPDKGKLPQIAGFTAPKVAVPGWLSALAKPVQVIGKNVANAAKAAREKDAREAAARAASVGSSVTSFVPPSPPSEWSSPPVIIGAASLALAVYVLVRGRR